MGVSSDGHAAGRSPSPLRAGALTGASWAVWVLWLGCVVFVAARVVEAVFDVGAALF